MAEKEKEIKNWILIFAWSLVFLGVAISILLITSYCRIELVNFSLKISPTASGQFGDFFGGVIGSLWALASVLFFYYALQVQRAEFNTQIKKLDESRLNENVYKQVSYCIDHLDRIELIEHSGTIPFDAQNAGFNLNTRKGLDAFTFINEKVPQDTRSNSLLLYCYKQGWRTKEDIQKNAKQINIEKQKLSDFLLELEEVSEEDLGELFADEIPNEEARKYFLSFIEQNIDTIEEITEGLYSSQEIIKSMINHNNLNEETISRLKLIFWANIGAIRASTIKNLASFQFEATDLSNLDKQMLNRIKNCQHKLSHITSFFVI